MKIEEVLKKIRENPKKEFSNEFGYIMKTETNGIVVHLDMEGDGFGIDINHEWEEVKKPVSFMEAIRSRKKLRVEHEFISEPYEKEELSNEYKHLGEIFEIFARYWGDNSVVAIVENGKWYIED